ncbi:MAG: hypothetical protein JWP61_1718, partial [Friedmanniella sp.]|nr:hypothetical protein [Friedmanniella sp.]
MRAAASLAWAGLRHRPAAWLLLALGVLLATTLPVVAAGLRAETSGAAIAAATGA